MADWIQQNFPDIYRIGMQGVNSWPDAIYATLYMTVISFIIGGLLGLVMGLFLVLTGPRGVIENKFAKQILEMEKVGTPKEEIEKLGTGRLRLAVVDGDVENGSVMAGQVAAMVNEPMSTKEILEGFMRELEEEKVKLAERMNSWK